MMTEDSIKKSRIQIFCEKISIWLWKFMKLLWKNYQFIVKKWSIHCEKISIYWLHAILVAVFFFFIFFIMYSRQKYVGVRKLEYQRYRKFTREGLCWLYLWFFGSKKIFGILQNFDWRTRFWKISHFYPHLYRFNGCFVFFVQWLRK